MNTPIPRAADSGVRRRAKASRRGSDEGQPASILKKIVVAQGAPSGIRA
jgi:hypothetical protein